MKVYKNLEYTYVLYDTVIGLCIKYDPTLNWRSFKWEHDKNMSAEYVLWISFNTVLNLQSDPNNILYPVSQIMV